jgi:phosphate acetyltransferase
MQSIENKTFDEIKVGDSTELTRKRKTEDIELFAVMSGDMNPANVDVEYAHSDMFYKVIAHGMWGGALISTMLGTEPPGPGGTVKTSVTVVQKEAKHLQVTLDRLCTNQRGETVIEGQALVMAPTPKVHRPRIALPEVAILSAVETVTSKTPPRLDATALCKMADRG